MKLYEFKPSALMYTYDQRFIILFVCELCDCALCASQRALVILGQFTVFLGKRTHIGAVPPMSLKPALPFDPNTLDNSTN